MRHLLAVGAIFVAVGCSRPVEPALTTEDPVCVIGLVFEAESGRTSFLQDNAAMIVDLTSTGAALVASDTSLPEIKILTHAACVDFEGSHLGLSIPDGALAGTTETTEADARRLMGELNLRSAPINQDTPRACIVRIGPPPRERSGEIMSALATGGVRNPFVTANEDALFAAYDDPCELVRSHVEAIVDRYGSAWPPANFCANVALNQCGFDGFIGLE